MGTIACGIPAINALRFVKVYTPARAVKAVTVDHSLFVLLENGNIATNNSVNRNATYLVSTHQGYWQFYSVVKAARKLGAITESDKAEFRKKYEAAFSDNQIRYRFDHFAETAESIGIKLTPTQKKLLKSKRHMKKLFDKVAPR